MSAPFTDFDKGLMGVVPTPRPPMFTGADIGMERFNRLQQLLQSGSPEEQALALRELRSLSELAPAMGTGRISTAEGGGLVPPGPAPAAPEGSGIMEGLAGARVPVSMPPRPPVQQPPPAAPSFDVARQALESIQPTEPAEYEPLSTAEKIATYLAGIAGGAASTPDYLGGAAAGGARAYLGIKEHEREGKQLQREGERVFEREKFDKAAKLAELDMERQQAERGYQVQLADVEFKNQMLKYQHSRDVMAAKQPDYRIVDGNLFITQTEAGEGGELFRVPKMIPLDPVMRQLEVLTKKAVLAKALGASEAQQKLVIGAGAELELSGVADTDTRNDITATWLRIVFSPDDPDVVAAKEIAQENLGGPMLEFNLAGKPEEFQNLVNAEAMRVLLTRNPPGSGK